MNSQDENTAENGEMDTVERNTGQWEKRLEYWNADGSIVMRVEKFLYKIHISMFTRLSPDLASILAIPDGKAPGDPSKEGTELYPLLLPGLTVQEFEDFLAWVYHSVDRQILEDFEQKERLFMNVLKVSDMWQIEVGRNCAIDELNGMAIAPSRRLELAGKYSIHHWVEGAVKSIYTTKVTHLSDEDLARIGLKVYSILVKGTIRMETEIRRTAQVEPAMLKDPDWRCDNHSRCAAVWKRIWWDIIGRKLLHPVSPIETGAILAEVKKMGHQDLNVRCRNDMVKEMESNIEFVDKRVIAGVVDSIVAHNKKL